ncbi:MAG TPA: oligosaccharide flippase family protein, partial [Verrucomicrobiae bacterium]|nr:oligosaccharide flippase family protein [Verrucomicrobiae bacterium]
MKRGMPLGPTLVLTAGRALAFGATFCIPIVLARSLDVAEFGTYKQVFLIFTTVYLMAQMGMAESLFYFIPHDPDRAGRFVANSTAALLAVGATAAAGLLAASATIGARFGNPALAKHLPLLGLFLLLSMGSAPLEIVLTARRKYAGAASTYCLSDVAKAICLVAPAALAAGVQGILAGAVLFAAIRLLAALAVYRRGLGSELSPDARLFASQLAYTVPMGLYVLVEIAQANLHQYAVSLHVAPAAFAVYAVGCLQIPLVEFVASPACNVMMVGIRDRLRSGDADAALAIWRDMTGKLALMIIPLVALLLICGGDLIRALFTEKYAASVPIFLLWTTSLAFQIFQTDGVLRAFAETRLLLAIGVMKLLVVATAVGWFLARFGLRGPVLVTLIATLLGKAAGLARMKRLFGAPLADLLPWRGILAAALAAAAAALPAAMA